MLETENPVNILCAKKFFENMCGREESRSIVLVTYWENLLNNTYSQYKIQKQNCDIIVFGLGKKNQIFSLRIPYTD